MSRPAVHPAAVPNDQLLGECDTRRLRRSGPGGQHRNKVETAVVLTHRPTGVNAEANERRSQAENRSVALRRLRVNLALEVRYPCGDDAVPSPLWQSRCPAGRLSVSRSHEDFPTLLAEALDVLAIAEADARQTAARLGCSSSQLVKLLKQEPRALVLVNRWRQQRELYPLK